MNINGLGATGLNYAAMKLNNEKAAEKISEKPSGAASTAAEAEKAADGNRDAFVRGIDDEPVTYANTQTGRLTQDQITALKDAQIESYKKFISEMFGNQAEKSGFLTELNQILGADSTASADNFENDPTWGVDAVATRIMSLAENLAGGDASKLETLRNAVERGFGEAKKTWGGKMPSISGKTYDEVMKRFDALSEKLNGGEAAKAEE